MGSAHAHLVKGLKRHKVPYYLANKELPHCVFKWIMMDFHVWCGKVTSPRWELLTVTVNIRGKDGYYLFECLLVEDMGGKT